MIKICCCIQRRVFSVTRRECGVDLSSDLNTPENAMFDSYPGDFHSAAIVLMRGDIRSPMSRENLCRLRGIFMSARSFSALSFRCRDGLNNIADIAACIDAAGAHDWNRIKVLSFHGVWAKGAFLDWTQMEAVMKKCLQGLESLYLGIKTTGFGCGIRIILDCVFLSDELSNIINVDLEGCMNLAWKHSAKCLGNLATRTKLRTLHLGHHRLTNDDILNMAHSLPSGLESLAFDVDPFLRDPSKCGRAMGKFIADSDHLYHLTISADSPLPVQNEFVLGLTDGIRRNRTLRECVLALPPRLASDSTLGLVEKALIEMVEGNCRLLNLEITTNNGESFSPAINSHLEFLLELNRFGRHKIMGGGYLARRATYKDWAELIVETSTNLFPQDELSMIYYYLTQNPCIVTHQLRDNCSPSGSKRPYHQISL